MSVLTRDPRWQATKRQRKQEQARAPGRLLALYVIVLAAFAVLSLQLFRLQIVRGDEFEARAQNNRLRTVQIPTQRGLIYDRNGKPLVENVPSFTVTLTPADVPEERRNAVYDTLAQLLGVQREELARQVALREAAGDPFSPIKVKTDVTREQVFTLQELRADLPGVEVTVETTRRYLGGPAMSHILGYVAGISAEQYQELRDEGYGINDEIGQTGVEATYEDVLRGRPGRKEVEIDAAGRELQVLSEVPPTPGSDVVLSIDADLQQAVDRILRESLGDTTTGTGSAVVMDVHTGEILALASLPTYDNNVFTSARNDEAIRRLLTDPARPLLNHAIGDNYPPGSTFKVITGSAALQEGVATPSTTIFGGGVLYVQNQEDPSVITPFYDWATLPFFMDFFQGLANSSDVYFYCLAGGCEDERHRLDPGLGVNRLARYAREFGLGEPTGIDLPGEASGLVPDPAWKEQHFLELYPDRPTEAQWFLGDTYFFGIGQGFLTATPLQMARVAAAIANGGKVLEPTVVHRVQDQEGNATAGTDTEVVRQLSVSAENLEIMRRAMRYAVTNGTASRAEVPGVGVAGKTGTAEFGQVVRTTVGGRNEFNEAGWFIGFAPYNDPQVAIAVYLQRDEKTGGGADAAPAASRILREYFARYPAGRAVQQPGGVP